MFSNIEILGRVVADAQVKTTKNGGSYIDMRMVVNKFKGKGVEPETQWYNVRAFNWPTAMAQYYTKGKPLYVKGSYDQKLYTTTDGRTMIDNNITAFDIEFIDSGQQEQQGEASKASSSNGALRNPSVASTAKSASKKKSEAPKAEPIAVHDNVDDDLPF